MHIRLRKYVAKLKRDFPLKSASIRVRTAKILLGDPDKKGKRHRIFGTACRYEDYDLIIIERHADLSIQIDTLWHEWTHLILWPKCKYRHTKLFWCKYGEIYHHYLDTP